MTARQLYVRNPKDYETDRLLETIHLKIPQNQMDCLDLNKEMGRPLLFKLFKRKFNGTINKLQFNMALAKIKDEEIIVKPKPPSALANYPRPDVPKEKNIHWCPQQGVWAVRFKKDGKTINVGRHAEMSRAKKVAEEYRNNLA